MLQYKSIERLDSVMLEQQVLLTESISTPYTGFYSKKIWTWFALGLSVILFVLLFTSAIMVTTVDSADLRP